MSRTEMNEILGVLGIEIEIDSDIENLLWMNVTFEELDFSDKEPEEHIADAFVPENIETM